MPILDASVLDSDPEGTALLRSILEAGKRSTEPRRRRSRSQADANASPGPASARRDRAAPWSQAQTVREEITSPAGAHDVHDRTLLEAMAK